MNYLINLISILLDNTEHNLYPTLVFNTNKLWVSKFI